MYVSIVSGPLVVRPCGFMRARGGYSGSSFEIVIFAGRRSRLDILTSDAGDTTNSYVAGTSSTQSNAWTCTVSAARTAGTIAIAATIRMAILMRQTSVAALHT